MKVRFKKRNPRYRELTPGNVYRVIGIEADDYRLMNDNGEPYLYPPKLFEIVDSSEPADWRTFHGDDGERYSYASALSKPGFFEDYFDGDRKAIATLHAYLRGQQETRTRVSRARRMAG